MRQIILNLLIFFPLGVFAQSPLPACPSAGVKHNCRGEMVTVSGIKFVGEFQRGLPNGNGSATLPDGSTYTGTFRDGLRHGEGTHITARGLTYVGSWRDDKATGRGILTYPNNGNRYIGEFKNNKFHGIGAFVLRDGGRYVGEFQDGNRNGPGIFYNPDGTLKDSGIWRQNILEAAHPIDASRFPFIFGDQGQSNSGQSAPSLQAASVARAHALVIGNAAYPGSARLDNTTNDSNAIAEKLRSLGFTVTIVNDANRQQLVQAITQFRRSAADADLSLLFYAGHGIQIFGTNYLLPVDADLSDPAQASIQGMRLNEIVENMLPGKAKLVFLDACRDNPLQRTGDRSVTKGLAPISVAQGTLIAYATKDGQTASDGPGQKNSPFTQALLQHLSDPSDIGVVLRRVREKVMQATGGKQQPWDYGSLTGGELVLSSIRPNR